MSNKRNVEQSQTKKGPDTFSNIIRNGSTSLSWAEMQKRPIDLQFLTFTHPSDAKDSANREAVRSHVTHLQHAREYNAQVQGVTAAFSRANSEPEEGTNSLGYAVTLPFAQLRTNLPIPSRATFKTSPSVVLPTRLPMGTAGLVDIFQLYPKEWQLCVHRVINHYLGNMSSGIHDSDSPESKELLYSAFFSFVLTDQALLHAVLLVAASHYFNVHGTQSHNIDILQLRGMAIVDINRAMLIESRATSDQLIAAVANMALYEAFFGDRKTFHTHMTGLLQLIRLRGGLQFLGFNGIIERMLLWIDTEAARATGSEIYFDSITFS